MELNSIIFPSPSFSHNIELYSEEVIYVPKVDFYGDTYKKSTTYNNISSFSSNSKSSFKIDKNNKNGDLLSNKFNKSETFTNNEGVEGGNHNDMSNIILDSSKILGYIPCLLLQYKKKNLLSKNFMIYFHGNAEDIFFARDIADRLRLNLAVCLYFFTLIYLLLSTNFHYFQL